MKSKYFILPSVSFLFFFVIYILELSSPIKVDELASREIASIDKAKGKISFLSLEELKALNPLELKNYLTGISKIVVKAGYLRGRFSKLSSPPGSYKKGLFINEAHADLRYCSAMKGLTPYKTNTYKECDTVTPDSFPIEVGQTDEFQEVRNKISNNKVYSYVVCKEGAMCNPVLTGFEFKDGKANLRCLKEASNKNCAELEVDKDTLKKSQELLEKANPEFWKEFTKGVEKLCLKDGDFNMQDESCKYVKEKVSEHTELFRGKLSNAVRGVKGLESDKVCKQLYDETEVGIADHQNFDAPGVKLVIRGNECYRVPVESVVSREKFISQSRERYIFSKTDGKTAAERREEEKKYDEKISINLDDALDDFVEQELKNLNFPVVENKSTNQSTIGTSRFYNFNCGLCNSAIDVKKCLSEMQKSADQRGKIEYEKMSLNSPRQMTKKDCSDLIETLSTLKVPEVIQNKIEEQGDSSFYDAKSIR